MKSCAKWPFSKKFKKNAFFYKKGFDSCLGWLYKPPHRRRQRRPQKRPRQSLNDDWKKSSLILRNDSTLKIRLYIFSPLEENSQINCWHTFWNVLDISRKSSASLIEMMFWLMKRFLNTVDIRRDTQTAGRLVLVTLTKIYIFPTLEAYLIDSNIYVATTVNSFEVR